jgi:hypothetical protein
LSRLKLGARNRRSEDFFMMFPPAGSGLDAEKS